MTTTVQLLRLETTRALVACDCMRPLNDPNEISEPTRETSQRLQCQTFSTQWTCEVQTMRNLSGWPHFVLVLIDGLTLYSEPWAHFVSFIAMGSLCEHICSMGSQRVLVACMVSRCVFYCGDMGSFVCNGATGSTCTSICRPSPNAALRACSPPHRAPRASHALGATGSDLK